MPECLPDLPRYIRNTDAFGWQGADHPDGPWRSIPAPQSGLPWPTDGPAVQSREPASVVPEATGQPRPLSPAAQAVLTAANGASSYGPDDCLNEAPQIALATILAVADRVVPEAAEAVGDQHDEARRDQWLRIRWKLLAIAAELEGRHG